MSARSLFGWTATRPRARGTPIEPREHIAQLAGPLADQAGVELVDVQVKGSGPQRKVRVIVDRKGGVGIDACEELSRALSSRLDAENPIDSGYSLEVTSPGVHQRLDGRRAFDRVEGRAVLIHHDDPRGDRRQLEGVVHRADEAEVVIEVEGEQVRVPYEEIAKATQRLPW